MLIALPLTTAEIAFRKMEPLTASAKRLGWSKSSPTTTKIVCFTLKNWAGKELSHRSINKRLIERCARW